MGREAGSLLAVPQRSPTPWHWRTTSSAWRGFAKKPTCEQHKRREASENWRHSLLCFAKHKKGLPSAHSFRGKAAHEGSSSWSFTSICKWTSLSSGFDSFSLMWLIAYKCNYIRLYSSPTMTDLAVAGLAGEVHLTILELSVAMSFCFLTVHFIKRFSGLLFCKEIFSMTPQVPSFLSCRMNDE